MAIEFTRRGGLRQPLLGVLLVVAVTVALNVVGFLMALAAATVF